MTSQTEELRVLDVRRDLMAVADLIELCFSSQMDEDGREYLRYLRNMAYRSQNIHWRWGALEKVSVPLHGYVWEENNRVIGNISLVPYYFKGYWRYLVANVAVHPHYRRRGIARKLTKKGLDHICQHRVHSAWLQVREDNPAAVELYSSLGFVERARRSTWTSISPSVYLPPPDGMRVDSRKTADWPTQKKWLQMLYPEEIAWHLPFDLESMSPSLWAQMLNFFESRQIQHWAVYHRDCLIGAATWEATSRHADMIWLALPSLLESQMEYEEIAVQVLLSRIRKEIPSYRPLMVNFPAGRAQKAFQQANFKFEHTLIWMEVEMQHNRIVRDERMEW